MEILVVGKAVERSAKEMVQEIGQRLAAVRRARGWTQAVLADKLGLEKESVSRLESGKVAISIERLVMFCDVLDVPIEEVLTSASVHPTDEARTLIASLNGLAPAQRAIVLKSAHHLASLLKKEQHRE
ncbi:helix-turn-helix domain-containing protein [Burkholderia cepacia]|uniref:helix-turn-helix domain-containing protein n=1 Tax=Burkholderia cepacia TaxID=292 RepID=UPI003EE147D1